MAQEVVKRVGARAYRYLVERVRNPETGRMRAKWSYIGRLTEDAQPQAPPPRPPSETRERLIDALERVLERIEYRDLTADAVTREAGLSHGTFYRYFKNKREAVRAGLDRVKGIIDRERPSFDVMVTSRDNERVRVRAWVMLVLHAPLERTGLLRAWFEVLDADAELRAAREERRVATRAYFQAYLDRLSAAAIIKPIKAPHFAASLLSLFDSVLRTAAVERQGVNEEIAAGVAGVFDRAIFGEHTHMG